MVDNPRIVTVDGTHGLTRYGFHLLSICVINIFGQGLVCVKPSQTVKTLVFGTSWVVTLDLLHAHANLKC